MKALQIFKVALVVLFLTVGLIGCASTPPAQHPAVGQSDMSQQGDAQGAGSGADSSSMTEEVVPTHDHMAGMENVYFDFDQSFIRPADRPTLQEVASHLASNPGDQLLVEGHCDWRGTTEYNMALGDRRAGSVVAYLQQLGVSADRMETVSKGDLEAMTEGTEDQMSQDRRGDLIIVR